jgi:hypothetical protein
MWSIDKTISTLKYANDFLLVQINMDDIIFGGSSYVFVLSFQKMLKKKFKMSMMGELTIFLGI